MNDQPPDARPVLPPDPDPTPTQAIPATPAKQRLQDRLWSLRAVIAVALASVIVGGLGGAALANVSQDGNDMRRGPGGFRGGPGGPPGMFNGGPGQRNFGPQGRDDSRDRFRDPRGYGQRDQRGGQPNQPGQPLSPAPSPTLPKQSD